MLKRVRHTDVKSLEIAEEKVPPLFVITFENAWTSQIRRVLLHFLMKVVAINSK